jgi:cardiolipin synthase
MRGLLHGFVALVASGLLAACAAPGETESDTLVGRMPDLAIEADGALYLRYPDARRPVVLWAAWPPDEPGAPAARYRAARLEVRTDSVDLGALQTRGRAVEIRPAADWQALLARLLTDLAPTAPDEAALAVVQGRDIVFAAANGTLQIHRHEDKPAALRVTRVVSEDELSRRAGLLLVERHGADAALLFDTGGGEAGRTLVFIDVASGRSVWVSPSSAIGAGGAPPPDVGLALSLTEALVIRSHLLTPLTQPVTSLTRLTWLTLQTALGLVPRTQPAAQTPPPAGTQAPMDLATFDAELDAEIPDSRSQARLSLLIDGDAYFPRLVQAIQEARSSVQVRLYIFDTDAYSLQLAELLRRRAASVRVEVLVDQLGTLAAGRARGKLPYVGGAGTGATASSIVEVLSADSAVQVRTSANPWLTSDHVKTVVVDDRLIFLGGMNFGQEYRYEWHDAMVEAEGPLAALVARDFRLAWAQAGPGGDLARWGRALRRPAEPPPDLPDPQGAAALRVLRTRTGAPEILAAHLAAIRRARQQILVQQPYLSDDEMIAALVSARGRGVDVRVVLPTAGDSGFMNAANLIAANVLLRHGARVYAYPGMTHVKATIVDGWACIGSANFDKLSLRINRELNIATSDEHFVAELRERLFERDFARSRELTEAQPVGWSTYLASFVANQL